MLRTQVWVRVSVADGGRIRTPPLVLQLLHPTDAAVPSNETPAPLDVRRASLASAEATATATAAQRGERGVVRESVGGEVGPSTSTVYSILQACQRDALQEAEGTAASPEEAIRTTDELLVVPYAALHDVLNRADWVTQQREASRQHARFAHRRLSQKRAQCLP
jgi:hypothetical protein